MHMQTSILFGLQSQIIMFYENICVHLGFIKGNAHQSLHQHLPGWFFKVCIL